MKPNDVSPLPTSGVQGDTLEALRTARSEAITAILEAEQVERTAKKTRKQANWKIKIYERMVAEYNGQLRLPVE